MAINRASLSDPLVAPHAGMRRAAPRSYASGHDGPRRTMMVLGGLGVALVSLAIASLAIAQVWLAPAAADGVGTTPALQSWEALTMILLGGLGFAAGAALIGIGMGRWTSPRPPESEADYTGPGDGIHDMPEPPRVV